MTLELGRMSTWRLPRFSALTMLLRQSAFSREVTGSAFSRTSRPGRGGGVNSRERRHAWLHGRKVHHDIECVPKARREKESEYHSEAGPVLTRDQRLGECGPREASERVCAEALVRTGQRCAVCRELVERGLALSVGESEDWTDTESTRGARPCWAVSSLSACASSSTRSRRLSPRARRPFRAPRELAHPASSARSSIM
jgi:hypothetical protein